MIIAGVDYSYTSPAIAIYDTKDDLEYKNIKLYNIYEETRKTKTMAGVYDNLTIEEMPLWKTQEERFDILSNWAIEKIKDVDLIVLEGYSYNSTGAIFDIAENSGVLKNKLYKIDKGFLLASPGAQKKCFTGKGNANKAKTIDSFIEKFNVNIADILGLNNTYKKPVDDLCDAISLMYFGVKNYADK